MGRVGSSCKASPSLRRFQPASRKPLLEHPIGGFEGRFGERGFVSILVHSGDRLSAKLPLTGALTEAGLDRCVRIARTFRKARLTDRGLPRRLTRRVRLGIRRA